MPTRKSDSNRSKTKSRTEVLDIVFTPSKKLTDYINGKKPLKKKKAR